MHSYWSEQDCVYEFATIVHWQVAEILVSLDHMIFSTLKIRITYICHDFGDVHKRGDKDGNVNVYSKPTSIWR